MPKTRLFHTLVLVGASLTGGAVATVATVSIVAIQGCDDSSPMDFGYPDIGLPPRDMAHPNYDLSQHD